MTTNYQLRYAAHPADAKSYDTSRLRSDFLIDNLFVENEVNMTVSFNGKARFQKTFAADASRDDIEKATLADDRSKHYMDGKSVVKVIVVPKRIVNIVLK